MANKILGGSSIDGFLEHPVTWSNWEAKLGRNVFATNPTTKALYSYRIEQVDSGGGNLLANGYYANPTELQGVIAEAANALALNGKPTATIAEAIAGAVAKIPDTIGVHAAFKQYGLGGKAKEVSNVDNVYDGGRYFGYSGEHPISTGGDNPFPTLEGAFSLDVIGKFFNIDGEYTTQITTSIDFNKPSMKFRTIASSAHGWSGWQEIYHSGNLNHAQNVSGATVASNSTISGANLSPSSAGTWRNISGNDILNNGYGLWQLV